MSLWHRNCADMNKPIYPAATALGMLVFKYSMECIFSHGGIILKPCCPCMSYKLLLPHAGDCGRFCFGEVSLWFLFVCVRNISATTERIGSRVWTLAWTTLKVEVKGEKLRSPGTKNSIFRPFSSLRAVYVW